MAFKPKPEPSPFPPRKNSRNGKQAATPISSRSATTVFEQLVARVATAFAEQRVRWLSHKRRQSLASYSIEKDMPSFRRMTRFFMQNNIADFRTFIYVQFQSRIGSSALLQARQCYGPKALERWQTFCEGQAETRESEELLLQSQIEIFQAAINMKKIAFDCNKIPHTQKQLLISVLCDPFLSLTPLFRYGAAVAGNLVRVAETYQQPALLQYLFGMKIYDQVWKSMVPQTLRDLASREYLFACNSGEDDCRGSI